jgi:membrane-bound lytic murein transglycosylase D
MQLLIKQSKILIFTVLCCSLLFILSGNNLQHPEKHFNVVKVITANSVWNNMSHEFKLNHKTESSQVQAEIRKLLADQNKFYSILKAAGPYIYFIYQQTKALGLPAEIALIPIIESEFNPNDHSNKGATGLWQLMPATAQELGVKVKSSYDGRRSVTASTKAALAYFNDLGNTFNGNWYLAIAAYNCGQMRIASAERRSGSHSFWNLPLPRETKYYVPKLLAVAAIIENPKKYGVRLPETINKPYFAELKVKKSVDLQQIAKKSGIEIKTLHTLNPDYNHGPALPNKKGSYTLLVPANKAPAVKEQLAGSIVTS